MVGFIDPNPPPKQPEKRPQEKWWKGMFTNPIQVKRPAQGKYSPKIDERCFTWCSQSVRGRTGGQDPWCRSICIRRVFEHEVRQLTSHFSQDAAQQSRASASTSAAKGSGPGPTLKYPLPPEGQRQLFKFGIGSDSDEDGDGRAGVEGEKVREVKYWEEGWYVWMTKNRWAAQEKMDLMMLDLDKQTNWNKMKEQDERAWAESQALLEKERARESHEPPAVVPEGADNEAHYGPVRHPYPNAAEESFLIRIPTRIDVGQYAQQTLAPTWKVLGILRQSFENGDQKDLALRAWEAVRSGTPFVLVKNVVKTCLDSLKKGPKDEDS